MALVQGQRFDGWEDLSRALEDWSIEEHFKYKVTHSDRGRKILKCAVIEPSCPFHLRASYSQRHHCIQVGAVDPRHTCLGTVSLPRPTESRQVWLARALPQTIGVTPTTTPADIISAIQLKYQVSINYDATYRAKRNALADNDDAERAQDQMLTHYISNIRDSHPDAHCHIILDRIGDVQPFEGLFVCPPTSKTTFSFCRPFIALDGTFTKGIYKQVLMLAVGLDVENRGVVLAWASTTTESQRTWEYFMSHLKVAIPAINAASTTVISDRDKGLAAAGATTLHLANRVYCTQHLAENVRKYFGVGARDAFRQVAATVTKEMFERAMGGLYTLSPRAHEYVSAVRTQPAIATS